MTELTFHIEKNLSISSQNLVISIRSTNNISSGKPNLNSFGQLLSNQIKKIANQNELSLINSLLNEEINYQKRLKPNSLTPPHQEHIVHIPYTQSLTYLKQLAGTRKLYFNDKQLIVDFFSPIEFYYLIEVASNQKVNVSGRIKLRNEDFDIRDTDFICGGTQGWFIKGFMLRVIQTDISWKELKQAYSPDFELSLEEIKEMQLDQEHHESGTFPKIIFSGNSLETINVQKDPLPLLVLKDRMGAFADLWMDYGEGKQVAFHEIVKDVKGTKRSQTAEQAWEKDLLETDFIRKLSDSSFYYCPLDKVAKSLSFLLELGWKVVDAKGNQVLHQTSTQFSLKSMQDSLLIQGKIKYEQFEANINEVIGSFNRRENFVQLGIGTVGLLPSWEQTGLSGVVEEGELVTEGIKLPRNRIGTLTDFFAKEPHATLDPSVLELREELKSINGLSSVSLGPGFKGELRPYQQEGVQWLAFLHRYHFHGILADDMGLGKTVQVLAFLSQLENRTPILIVLPTSLLFNWLREIERFLPHKKVYLHHGALRNANQLKDHDIILTSYTTLRVDLSFFSPMTFDCLILDEAQAIKNAHTQSAQAIFSLKARFRLSLTGTPIENSLNELWSHFHFLIPELLGTEQDFTSQIQAAQSDPRYLQRIRKKIRPFILRRKKEDVAKDLPECIEQTVWVEMGPAQKKLYEDFLAGFKGNLFKKVEVEGLSKHRMEVFEAILRLRQICCHPLLVSSQLTEQTEYDSCKLEALMQDLETVIAEGRKALVYSQFTGMLALLSKAVRAKGWNYAYLDGSTKDREKVVTEFQQNPEIPLFLISLKAGGVGLNLTAADYVFLYDPWWNEAIEQQAISRAHRIGRRDVVVAKRYIAIESIEEKIMKLKASKRSLVDDILEGDERGSMNLTEDDFQFLFS